MCSCKAHVQSVKSRISVEGRLCSKMSAVNPEAKLKKKITVLAVKPTKEIKKHRLKYLIHKKAEKEEQGHKGQTKRKENK